MSTLPAQSEARDRSVLIVDDDDAIREVVAEVLRDEGYGVICAANGAQALEALGNEPLPHLILLDLMMPVMSGWELLEHLQGSDRTSHIPVVIVSAMAAPGVSEHLSKPIALDVLLDTVQRWTH
jgi:CheY-like chemotaxis protein